jgi:hypothetical protein
LKFFAYHNLSLVSSFYQGITNFNEMIEDIIGTKAKDDQRNEVESINKSKTIIDETFVSMWVLVLIYGSGASREP